MIYRERYIHINNYNDKYIIGEDVGTAVDDMNQIYTQTKHVVGIGEGSGDPSPTTAFGVYKGLKAAVLYRLHRSDLSELKVAVQGLGNVGYNLCKLLAKDGVKLFVTDMQRERVDQAVKELGATAVGLNEIYTQDVDVFAPCALGAILNDNTIKTIKARVIAGAANNQLAEPRHGLMLREAKILYAPDYVINAGGLISVYYEQLARTTGKTYDRTEALACVDKIEDTLESVFRRADQDDIPTSLAADRVAEQRISAGPTSKAA